MTNPFRLAAFAALALCVTQVQAATIIGGSAILSGSDANQLETWLDDGPINLSNIFTRQVGDTAANWHAAVDGQGPTISVLALDNGLVIGGYNPASWASSGEYNYTYPNEQRTAFLFNLTSVALFSQILEANRGQLQTYNVSWYGPTFGGGHDLQVQNNLTNGYANIGHTYGDVTQYGFTGYRSTFSGSYNSWTITAMETFAVSEAAAVPLPGGLGPLIGSLGAIGWASRKRRVQDARSST